MKGIATKAVYAAVGAPMVATRRLGEFGERMVEGARKEYEVAATQESKLRRIIGPAQRGETS